MYVFLIFLLIGDVSFLSPDLLPGEDYASFLTLIGASYVNGNFHILGSGNEDPVVVYLDSMEITNEMENMPYFYIPSYLIKSISMDSKGAVYVNLKKNLRNIDFYGDIYHYPRFGVSIADTYLDTSTNRVLVSRDYVPFYRRGEISYTFEREGFNGVLSYFHRSSRDYFMPYINKKDGIYGHCGISKGRQKLNLSIYYSRKKYQNFYIRWKYLPEHTPYYQKQGINISGRWSLMPAADKEYFIRASYQNQEAKAYIFEDEDGDGIDDYSDNDYDGYVELNGKETNYGWNSPLNYPPPIFNFKGYYINGYYPNEEYMSTILQYTICGGIDTKKIKSGIELKQWVGKYYKVYGNIFPFFLREYKYNPIKFSSYLFLAFGNPFIVVDVDLSIGIFHPLKEYQAPVRDSGFIYLKGEIKPIKKLYINARIPSSTPIFLEISGGGIDRLPNFSSLFYHSDWGILTGNPDINPSTAYFIRSSLIYRNKYFFVSGFFNIYKEYNLPLEEYVVDIASDTYTNCGYRTYINVGVKGKIFYKNNFFFLRVIVDSTKGNFYSNSPSALFPYLIPEFVPYSRKFRTDGGIILNLPDIKNIHHSISGIFHRWSGSHWVQTHWDGTITRGIYPDYFRIDARYTLSLDISRLNLGIFADIYNVLDRKNLKNEVNTEGDWNGKYDDPSVWDIPRTIYIGFIIK